jgi:hypothetical protein
MLIQQIFKEILHRVKPAKYYLMVVVFLFLFSAKTLNLSKPISSLSDIYIFIGWDLIYLFYFFCGRNEKKGG